MILDTNALSAVLAGDEALGDLLASDERHHLPTVVLGEYRYGLQRSHHRAHLEPLLDIVARESIVLRVDEDTARHYSEVREELRRAGTPIPENDVWVAALARQYGLAVVSRDRHFDLVDGIRRAGW